MLALSSRLNEIFPYATQILLLVLAYLLYKAYFKGITFKCVGPYDAKMKNIGRPLPAYPNGWYVAIRSK